MVSAALALAAADRVWVLAPHPDDDVLAAGVLLQRAGAVGAARRVVFATDGERNDWVLRLLLRRWRLRPDDVARFGALRRGQALAGLAVLGVAAADVAFLGLPDTAITALLGPQAAAAIARLADDLAAFAPTVVVAPALSDLHPDHSALAILVRLALARVPAARRPARSLAYVVHGAASAPRAAWTLVPDADERRAKAAAIRRHRAPMTVHRRGFLARCARPERFEDAAAARTSPPIRGATLGVDGTLSLDLVDRPRPGAFGARTAVVLATDATRTALVARMELPIDGMAIAWRGSAPAPGAERFVKVERRFGFFDEGGWSVVGGEPPPTRGDDAPPAPAAAIGRAVAVVPCYQVAALCGAVVEGVAPLVDRVLAVDDGSTDGTGDVLRARAAASAGRVEVVALPHNGGKGAAMLRAFARALEDPRVDVVVTLDGDGQHRPQDVPGLVAACRAGADLAIGSRRMTAGAPWRSRVGNRATATLMRRLFPRAPADTQSGLRAHRRAFVEAIVRAIPGRRYETEMQILLLALARGLDVREVAIPTVYLDRNRSSHFRPVADSMRVWGSVVRWIRAHGWPARRRAAREGLA